VRGIFLNKIANVLIEPTTYLPQGIMTGNATHTAMTACTVPNTDIGPFFLRPNIGDRAVHFVPYQYCFVCDNSCKGLSCAWTSK